MNVDVVYAWPDRAVVRTLQLAAGATLGHALKLAAEDPAFGAIELDHVPVGIFGKLAPRERVLEEGDRIEIYRPLENDPKSARRERARAAGAGLNRSGRS